MKILKFWGIPIHKILSDDEFVEKNKKFLRLSKKFAWFHIAVLILLSVFFPKLIHWIWQMIDEMSDEARKWALIGLILGFTFGAVIAQYILIAVQSILMSLDLFDFNRSTRLLIKYHDMLQEIGILEQDNEQEDERILAKGEIP